MQSPKLSSERALARQGGLSFSTPAKDACLSPALLSSPKEERDSAQSQSPAAEGKGYWTQTGSGCSHFFEQLTWQQKAIQAQWDCSSCTWIHSHVFFIQRCQSYTFYLPAISFYQQHLSLTFLLSFSPHLYLWMPTVRHNLSQISLTYLYHKKSLPKLTRHIRHAWISKEMKTGHRKGVGWRKSWRCNANQSHRVAFNRNSGIRYEKIWKVLIKLWKFLLKKIKKNNQELFPKQA